MEGPDYRCRTPPNGQKDQDDSFLAALIAETGSLACQATQFTRSGVQAFAKGWHIPGRQSSHTQVVVRLQSI